MIHFGVFSAFLTHFSLQVQFENMSDKFVTIKENSFASFAEENWKPRK